MKPLEDVIRESAERGRLNHFSIAWTDRGWEVAYRGVENHDRQIVAHEDPVCAIYAALTGKAPEAPKRKRRQRASPKPSESTLSGWNETIQKMNERSRPEADPFDDILG